MFLRLTPIAAIGRASGALGIVVGSMAGHVAAGHHHVDLSRAAMAFVVMLGAVWSTDDQRRLLGYAALAQLLVHGGLPMQPLMLTVHLVGALVALHISRAMETAWRMREHLSAPLRSVLFVGPACPPALVRPVCNASAPILLRHQYRNVVLQLRGPPIPA